MSSSGVREGLPRLIGVIHLPPLIGSPRPWSAVAGGA